MSLPTLLEHLKQTTALDQVAGLLSWDQEAMMPERGTAQRAEQAGAMAAVIHARKSDPRVPEWVAGVDRASLSPADRRNVDEAQRAYDRATKIPQRLAEESARAASEGHRIWVAALEAKDFAQFAPALKRNIDLKREEAACLTGAGGNPYDALLDEYEPGARVTELAPLLESLRGPLVALRERIAGKPEPAPLTGRFPRRPANGACRKDRPPAGLRFQRRAARQGGASVLFRHRRRCPDHDADR